MREIVVTPTWQHKLQDLVARRRESWPLLILVGAIAVASLIVAGPSAEPKIAPPAVAEPMAQPGAVEPDAGSQLMVHVAGAVREPGLYGFAEGDRVADAVTAAGGPLRRADLDSLNLAAPLADGTKVEVLRIGETPSVSVSATSPAAGTSAATISLNSADQAALETIPGIGPVTATAILQYRSEIGSFESLEQLLEVDGIGPATFDNLRSFLTL